MSVEKESFDGACAAAQEEPSLWRCSRCAFANPLWSWFAYVLKGTMILAKCPDVQVQRAIEGGKFANSFDESTVDLVCCRCCAAANGKEAEWLKDGGKPTNRWVRLARESKERPAEAKRARFILNRLDEKRAAVDPEPMGVTSVEVYDALLKSKELRKSTDWCTILGPWCCFLYGCPECNRYPVVSSNWWRLIKSTKECEEGSTTNGEKHGQWACGSCLAHWTWSSGGGTRLFVFGDGGLWNQLDDSMTGEQQEEVISSRYAFVGHIGQDLENKLNFLKGAQVLKFLDGRPITFSNLMKCLEEIGSKTFARLEKIPELRWVSAANPTAHWRAGMFKVICEDINLSLRRPGKQYATIDLGALPQMPPTFDEADVSELVDAIAATLDFEKAPTAGPAERRIQQRLAGNSNVQGIRRMLARM